MTSTFEDPTAFLASFAPGRQGFGLRLDRPELVLRTDRPEEVGPLLVRLDGLARAGAFVAFALSYEAAGALDAGLAVHPGDGVPLLWAAVSDRASCPQRRPPVVGGYEVGPWRPLVGRRAYLENVERIRDSIRLGESYQVNYTLPFVSHVAGHALGWLHSLAARQACAYAAYLDMGRFVVLCASPELFFHRRDGRLRVRPMKGTMRRGATPAEDARLAARLAACPKNRAENAIIVDLMRNDLGRVARTGTVAVTDLFAVETYPTVHQMVSGIEAEIAPDIGLVDILRALFPCGSVTGAPKKRTMEIIRECEPHPRGIYCGAVGCLSPGGEAMAAVPIRTVTLDRRSGEARLGVGGGVTFDSSPEDEYDECLIKMRFLGATEGRPPRRPRS